MKKLLNILLILTTSLMVTGCHKYIKAEKVVSQDSVAKTYYGAYNRCDLTWADVILYEKGSDVYCNGVLHLNSPSRAITFKNDNVDAVMKLACSDGKLFDLDWTLEKAHFADGEGKGVDQYNNEYNVSTIKKKEYKKNINHPAKVPSKNFLLKY